MTRYQWRYLSYSLAPHKYEYITPCTSLLHFTAHCFSKEAIFYDATIHPKPPSNYYEYHE